MHVGKPLGIELVVALTGVVVREIEIVIEHDALHDQEVVRLVGGRRRDGPVVRKHDKGGREQGRAEQDRRAGIAETRNYGPQRVERIHGKAHRDEQIDEAELGVGNEEAPHAEEQDRPREIEREVPREESGARARFEVPADRGGEGCRDHERGRQPPGREAARNVAELADPRLRDSYRHKGERDRVGREESAEL